MSREASSPSHEQPTRQAVTAAWPWPTGVPWRDALSQAWTPAAWRRLALPLALLLALGLSLPTLDLVFYKVAGLGPGQLGIYLNPLAQPPAELFAGLAVYLPIYLASLLGALPMDLGMKEPSLMVPVLIAGAVLPVLFFVGWRKVRGRLSETHRKALAWWVPGATGALLPMALAPPAERQLLVPATGLAPLLASFAVVAWGTWRQPQAGRWSSKSSTARCSALRRSGSSWPAARRSRRVRLSRPRSSPRRSSRPTRRGSLIRPSNPWHNDALERSLRNLTMELTAPEGR